MALGVGLKKTIMDDKKSDDMFSRLDTRSDKRTPANS